METLPQPEDHEDGWIRLPTGTFSNHSIYRQIDPQNRMVSVNVTANSDAVNDRMDSFRFDVQDFPKLNIDDLFWIGMHDTNRNGEHKWASGMDLPFPLQWYRDRPANPGKFHGYKN